VKDFLKIYFSTHLERYDLWNVLDLDPREIACDNSWMGYRRYGNHESLDIDINRLRQLHRLVRNLLGIMASSLARNSQDSKEFLAW